MKRLHLNPNLCGTTAKRKITRAVPSDGDFVPVWRCGQARPRAAMLKKISKPRAEMQISILSVSKQDIRYSEGENKRRK
jgi:hypothetical protein